MYSESMDGPLFTHYLGKIVSDLKNEQHKNHNFVLVMDSASYHRSDHTAQWLKDHRIKFIEKIEWSSSSPDINSIENLRCTIQNRITSKKPKTNLALKNIAIEFGTTSPNKKYLNILTPSLKGMLILFEQKVLR